MSSEEHKALARRVREEFVSTGDAAVADVVLAEDFVYHGPAMLPELRGREAFKQAIAGFRAGIPDLRETVEEQFACGDVVVSRFTNRGTHTGSMPGMPPTGNSVGGWGLDIIRIRDGRVVEMWAMFDTHTFLQQLGAVPDAPAASTP